MLIAISRLLLSATLFVMAIADDQGIGFVLELDDVLLAYFSYLALAQLLVLLVSWWLNFRLRIVSYFVDITLYICLMYVVEPMHSGNFASSIAMLAFLIVTAAVQWGWRRAFQIAILLNLVCLGMILQMWANGMEMSYPVLLRRQVFQLLVSVFLVWITSFAQMRWLQIPELSLTLSEEDLRNRQLGFALSSSGSRSGALCWIEPDQPSCITATISLPEHATNTCTNCPGAFVRSLSGPAMFDLRYERIVALNQDGQIEKTTMNADEREFALRHGFDRGVFVPLAGASGVGRLIYKRTLFAGVEHLRLAEEIGTKTAAAFDNHSLIRTAESIAADRQRLALARDLHDSVSQAFAGARFWVKSLRSRLPQNLEVAGDLDQLGKMLGAEQEQVQDLIIALRASSPGSGRADWRSELEFIVGRLANNWNVAIQLDAHGEGNMLPRSTVYNMAQLVREAIANAVRHGQASEISISCSRRDRHLELTIRDNGKGFRADDGKPASLSGRLQEMGGRLDVSSNSGSTFLTMTIPLGDT